MITRAVIEERVREWNLREDIVEKDYVLGWLLWGIGADEDLGRHWVFKGGTCLKKCYFETYRFSEDLDFTVLPGGPVRAEDVQPALVRVLARVQEQSGIQMDERPPLLKTHASGLYTEGRVYYRGPRNAPQVASIRLDLSASEQAARPPVLRTIGHAFPDELPAPAQVRCYSFEEVFAEKIRAMGERSRPRDLYDIINLYRRSDLRQHPQLVREVLAEKCRTKGLEVPTMASLNASPYRAEIETAWEDMLAHQLPSLPPFAAFWSELSALFAWLEGAPEPAALPTAPAQEETEVDWRPPATVFTWGQGVAIEPIRFAAANRLCVDLGYQGGTREIEPYALRRSKAGAILLVAVKTATRETRTYRVDRIESVHVTTKPFTPIYGVEIGGAGPLRIPDITRPRTEQSSAWRPAAHRPSATHYGPVYIIMCPVCQREFRRHSKDSSLRLHKDKHGWNCSGRTGYLVRME